MIYKKFKFDYGKFKNICSIQTSETDTQNFTDEDIVFIYSNILTDEVDKIVINTKSFTLEDGSFENNTGTTIICSTEDEFIEYQIFIPSKDVLITNSDLITNELDNNEIKENLDYYFDEKFNPEINSILFYKSTQFDCNTLKQRIFNNLTSYSSLDNTIKMARDYSLEEIFNIITKDIYINAEDYNILQLMLKQFKEQFNKAEEVIYKKSPYKKDEFINFMKDDYIDNKSKKITPEDKNTFLKENINFIDKFYPNLKAQEVVKLSSSNDRPSLINRLKEKSDAINNKERT